MIHIVRDLKGLTKDSNYKLHYIFYRSLRDSDGFISAIIFRLFVYNYLLPYICRRIKHNMKKIYIENKLNLAAMEGREDAGSVAIASHIPSTICSKPSSNETMYT